ncbi:MAG: helix-turn-helix domain-containing protein [Pseudomonadota bacterium]
MPATTNCPVQTSVDIIGGKWKPGLLYRLKGGPLRLSELRRQMPWVSERVLIRQLKELVTDGILERRDYGEIPPRVDYRLTKYGWSVVPLVEALADWGAVHLKTKSGPSRAV